MANEFRIKRGFISEGDGTVTGSLKVTSGVTASLLGTASYATQALSASFAPSTPTFPFTGSALITGSLGVTGSVSILAFTSSATNMFTVRNSANTANLINIQGNNIGNFSKVYFDLNSGVPQLYNTDTTAAAGSSILLGTTTISLRDANANFVRFIGGGTRSVAISNGAANTGLADAFELYSADRGGTAGKASAHFRAEDGTINVLGDLSGIGTSSPGARLDVRAQGALSTDIAFRVRNSADTRDLFNIRGNRTIELLADTPATNGGLNITADAYNAPIINFYDVFSNMLRIDASNRLIGLAGNGNIQIGSFTTTGYLGMVTPSTNNRFLKLVDAFSSEYLSIGGNTYDGGGGISMTLKTTTNNGTNFITFSRSNNTNKFVISDQANVGIGQDTFGTSAKYVLAMANATAPTTSPADAYQQYSADITAGNAAPHFRTENGSIIKLYKEIQPALSGSANTGDAATDALINAMKTIILNLGLGASS